MNVLCATARVTSARSIATTARLLTRLPYAVPSASLLGRHLSSKASYPPHIMISMPALSPTMTAGNIGVWHKKVGDEIAPGDVLVEIETDKAQMDFECQEEGFLAKMFMAAGSKEVPVNQPIAVLAEKAEDVGAFADFAPPQGDAAAATPSDAPAAEEKESAATEASAEKETSTESPAPSTNANGSRQFVSPIARVTAADKNVPLYQVQGTGPNGRVVKADVLGYTPSNKKPAADTATKTATKASAAPSSVSGSYEDIPLTNMRKVIASRLQESKGTIPHYYLTATVEMDKILSLRSAFNTQSKDKFKLSVNDFVIKAAALSLKAVPEVNSSWMDSFIRRHHNVDVCVAVSTPAGLITPIVTAADAKGLVVISDTVRDLAARARDNKLAPNEYQGGTFTISNLGMFGVDQFSAIINPPQSCILAVGGTTEKLVADASAPNGFTTVKVMNVTLSCDHRVVDGAVGAQWLAKFRDYMEHPLNMLL